MVTYEYFSEDNIKINYVSKRTEGRIHIPNQPDDIANKEVSQITKKYDLMVKKTRAIKEKLRKPSHIIRASVITGKYLIRRETLSLGCSSDFASMGLDIVAPKPDKIANS